MVLTGSLLDPANALNIAFFRTAEVSLGVAATLLVVAGVWIGAHVHFSDRGAGYVGTQAVVGFIVTLVQRFGPPDSVLPGVDRFAAMLGGLGILWLLSVGLLSVGPAVFQGRR